MIYQQEVLVMNIIQNALVHKNNLAVMRNYINEQLVEENHPFICTTSLMISLTDSGSIELGYYLTSTEYDAISGVMSI